MRNAKTLLIALVAVFAFSAVAASVASAGPPEFSKFPVTFTSKGGEAKLISSQGTVTCATVSNTGETTGKKAGSVTVTFSGCKITIAGKEYPCENTATEKIKTNLLKMTLGFTVNPKVGIDLSPKTGTELAKFTCDVNGVIEEITVKGSVIGEVTPLEVSTTEFTLAFAESAGKQAIQNLEGASKDTLEVFFGNVNAGEGVEIAKDELKTAEAITIS